MAEHVRRRVVTGLAADGRSVVRKDDTAPRVLETTPGGISLVELWSTNGEWLDPAGDADPAAGPVCITPPSGGTVFRLVEYPPDAQYLDGWDPEAAWRAMGGELPGPEGQRGHAAERHPAFHQTETVDYIVVVRGEIWALMEDGEVLLQSGDCLVQRGTNHAWSNRSSEPAVLAAVLVDAPRP